MRKIVSAFLIVALLGGCAQLQKAQQVFSLATASVANPVTKDRLNELEAGVTLVFVGLGTYKKLCVNGTADVNCKQNIADLQVYTRQVPDFLTKLRGFVKDNDQINATLVFNDITALISELRTEAASRGVNIGAAQ